MVRLRQVAPDERGFTLVELLVVILILAILAGIAIIVFTAQSRKAFDASAKQTLDGAQTAMETYRTDHGGYCGATLDALRAIEPTLNGASTLTLSACPGGRSSAYELSVRSASTAGIVFTLDYLDGRSLRTCSPVGDGCSNGSW